MAWFLTGGPRRGVIVGMTAGVLLVPWAAAGQYREGLEADLEALRTSLRIPTMSAAVAEAGTIVWVRHFGFKPAPGAPVPYAVSSLSEPFAAVVVLRLAERGRLSVDDPVDAGRGTSPSAGPDNVVRVRHLQSHTAAGRPGTRFLHSSELFRGLDAPIARAAGSSYAAALAAEVLKPFALRHTTASDGMTPGSGLRSTVEDLARFATAVERGKVLAGTSMTEMFRPPRAPGGHPFPFALGWFVQQIGGEQVRWHFGQDREGSALLVNLPRRRLTFVLLAASPRLCAPFWLEFGDLRWSPPAVAFLTRWARLRLDYGSARVALNQALIALSRGDRQAAAALTQKASVMAPGLVNGAEPVLLAAFARSGDRTLRDQGRRIADRLVTTDTEHPRTLLDRAVLEVEDGHGERAAPLLTRILETRQATPAIERAARDLLSKR